MLLMIEGLWKSYPGPEGPVPVLRGVTLSLEAGETLALTGKSGSGKSTLLHLVAGLDAADGAVLLDGGPASHAASALNLALPSLFPLPPKSLPARSAPNPTFPLPAGLHPPPQISGTASAGQHSPGNPPRPPARPNYPRG